MYLTQKSSKWNKYYGPSGILVLAADTTKVVKTKLINSVSDLIKTYRKYYNLYNVFIVYPNQMVYTNLDWTEKTRLKKE
ncbi:hypothetical protein GCM10023311_13770 [Flaviramulus aquimarinus]|uniref:Uncharacterized protein n=1 Tax=Flaviramulus aquimarinus TaxID=1170456 RepID=A0ABP9EZA2_9FLAO